MVKMQSLLNYPHSVLYLKASHCIQRSTLIPAGLKHLSSNGDLPQTAREEPVTEGKKGVALVFQLVHYTKSPIQLITLKPANLISK